jgi:vacuolar-type H+-ATPase subunit E/Vma4
MNRKEKEYMQKIANLEDIIDEFKNKIERSNIIFSQAQNKILEIESNSKRLNEKNNIMKEKIEEEKRDKMLVMENFSDFKQKVQGLIRIFRDFDKGNIRFNEHNFDLIEKLKYFFNK